MRDALYLARVVLQRVEHRPVLAGALRPVVEAADQLADDQQVDLPLPGRAQVRVDVESLSQRDEPLLGTDVGRVEAGQADRTEQHCVGLAAGGERLVRKRRAGGEDRRSAEEVFLQLEVGGEHGQYLPRRCGHLHPDPVAGQTDDLHAGICVRDRTDPVSDTFPRTRARRSDSATTSPTTIERRRPKALRRVGDGGDRGRSRLLVRQSSRREITAAGVAASRPCSTSPSAISPQPRQPHEEDERASGRGRERAKSSRRRGRSRSSRARRRRGA